MGKLDADLDLQQLLVWMKTTKKSYGMDTSELDELLQKRGYLAGAKLTISQQLCMGCTSFSRRHFRLAEAS
jgi:hypothetical protein